MTASVAATHCRICSGPLDTAAFIAGTGRHIVYPDSADTPEVLAAGSSAMAMVVRQRQACAAGTAVATPQTGVWLATGTPVEEPYPCRCPEFDGWQHAHKRCPCGDREDGVLMPDGCCAHVDAPPPRVPTSTIAELREVLIDYELARPRTMQQTLGPSELGTRCVAQMARKIARLPQRDLTSPSWAPFQGVAVHAEMEKVVAHWNAAIGWDRWIAEDELQVSADIVGHGDAFDVEQNMVIDWKHVGTTALKKLHSAQRQDKPPAEQVSQEYRVQAHLYGLGHERKGRTVDWVRLVLLARSWQYDDSGEWTERYNPELARWALDRYTATVALTRSLNLVPAAPGADAPNQDLIAVVPRSPGSECTWCPFYRPGRANDTFGCPGDEQAVLKAHERIGAGLITRPVATVNTTNVI